MSTDKTGAPTTVTGHSRNFTVAVDDTTAGVASFIDREGQRVFFHTEVKNPFEGRGLATILISEALVATRDQCLRIVPFCPMVAAYVAKHHDFDDIVDPVTRKIMHWLETELGS